MKNKRIFGLFSRLSKPLLTALVLCVTTNNAFGYTFNYICPNPLITAGSSQTYNNTTIPTVGSLCPNYSNLKYWTCLYGANTGMPYQETIASATFTGSQSVAFMGGGTYSGITTTTNLFCSPALVLTGLDGKDYLDTLWYPLDSSSWYSGYLSRVYATCTVKRSTDATTNVLPSNTTSSILTTCKTRKKFISDQVSAYNYSGNTFWIVNSYASKTEKYTANSVGALISNLEGTYTSAWDIPLFIVSGGNYNDGVQYFYPKSRDAYDTQLAYGYEVDFKCSENDSSSFAKVVYPGYKNTTYGSPAFSDGFKMDVSDLSSQSGNCGTAFINNKLVWCEKHATSPNVSTGTNGYVNIQDGVPLYFPESGAVCYIKPLHAITLDSKRYETVDSTSGASASNNPTATVYEKYNVGWYKEASATTEITGNTTLGTTPTMTGYDFKGYYTGKTGTGTKLFESDGKKASGASNTQFSNDGTLYAKWTANTYTVTLDKNSSTATNGSVTTIYEKYGTGYYKTNNSGTLSNQITTSSGLSSTELPSNPGYTFGGYYACDNATGNSGCEQIITSDGKLKSGASTTLFTSNSGKLFAKWTESTYTITLDKNGGTGGTDGPIYEKYGVGFYNNLSATAGTEITSITVPTRTGYTFDGYFYGSGFANTGTGSFYYNPQAAIYSNGNLVGKETEFHQDTTVYAGWLKDCANDYCYRDCFGVDAHETICSYETSCPADYVLTAGANTYNPTCTQATCITDGTHKSDTVTAVVTDNTVTCTAECADGYENNGTSSITTTGSAGAASVTLDSCYASTYTFTLNKNANDATAGSTSTIYEKYNTGWYTDNGTTNPITSSNKVGVPSRTNYDFGGYWTCSSGFDDAGCYQIITSSGELVNNVKQDFTADGTLYARWTVATYTISLHKNFGTGTCGGQSGTAVGTITCAAGSDCILPTWTNTDPKCNITKDTSILLGWANNQYDTTPTYTLGQNIKDILDGDKIVYAVWKNTNCNFDATVQSGTALAPENNLARCSYVCKPGYETDETITGASGVNELNYGCSAKNIDLYWYENQVGTEPVTHNSCNFGAKSDETGALQIPIPNPQKTGHTFIGWDIVQ